MQGDIEDMYQYSTNSDRWVTTILYYYLQTRGVWMSQKWKAFEQALPSLWQVHKTGIPGKSGCYDDNDVEVLLNSIETLQLHQD